MEHILGNLQNMAFWQDLAPDLHCFDEVYLAQQTIFAIEKNNVEVIKALLKEEGYFDMPPQSWNLPIHEMAALVKKLKESGLPAPFSFIYDEFWCLFLRLNKILEGVLGHGFKRLPDFWAWLVDPKNSESGWGPHRDKGFNSLFDDCSPKSVTVWIPLTDASPLNGCMYILPADRDPCYNSPQNKDFKFNFADIRALPANAGAVIIWTQAAYHWGAHSSKRASAPRISVAFEFQSCNTPPYNQPLTNPYEIPDFTFRLKLIAKQILQYQHMYPLTADIKGIAEALLA